MKLPFDFGLRFVLRLLAPGAILGATLFPVGQCLRAILYPSISDAVTYLVLGLLAGFSLLLLDMPIYMFLEGRRFWPNILKKAGIARQAKRLTKLRALADSASDPTAQVEYDLQAMQFPIDKHTGQPTAVYPTRLGNILTSYETYPTVKYGLDGVFYWPRLWVAIDKDLREELDSAQAVVDGAVYTCFAFGLTAVASLFYAAAGVGENPILWLGVSAAAVVLSFLCYRAALPRYVQYGELFAAVFDQHQDKLKYPLSLPDLDAHMNDLRAQARSAPEAARANWRFLRWHRYRRSAAMKNEGVTNWLA